jgi:hypothetical protein
VKKILLAICCLLAGCEQRDTPDSAASGGSHGLDRPGTLQAVIIADIDSYKRKRGIYLLRDDADTEYAGMSEHSDAKPEREDKNDPASALPQTRSSAR